jgi:hypothetical protein
METLVAEPLSRPQIQILSAPWHGTKQRAFMAVYESMEFRDMTQNNHRKHAKTIPKK